MHIEWNWRIVNDKFRELTKNKDRYIICYGGRGSSKSDYAAKQLIFNCLTHKHFRCIMIRKIQAKVKDSCYQNIKDLIDEMGLNDLFSFSSSPVPRIECINGNFFTGAGLDDTSKIKSVKDPTTIWWEEDIPDENDFITVTTSVRTLKAEYIQEIFSINPECEGDYRENWFFKRFFAKHYEKGELSFRDVLKIRIDDNDVEMPYTVHHSTHLDNKYLPEQYRAILLDLKRTNPYYYEVYTNGKWGTKVVAGRFYTEFKQEQHVSSQIAYDSTLPLHISFDFNVHPYISLSIWQIVDKELRCIDLIKGEEPHNNTKSVCTLFKQKYATHYGGLFVYGDPAGKHQDTRTETGHNDFTIILAELEKYYPQLRVLEKAPSVSMRGNFINAIFRDNFEGLKIIIAEHCHELINDLLFGKMSSDGTKHKEKFKDKEKGITYEKYHHFSDNMDYLIVRAFFNEYSLFQSGGVHFDYSTCNSQIFEY